MPHQASLFINIGTTNEAIADSLLGHRGLSVITNNLNVATILAVKEGIASINAGSAKGIRSGMRLVVYRGAQFVGYLKIIEVEAQEAAGLMVDTAVQAQQGDKVTDE